MGSNRTPTRISLPVCATAPRSSPRRRSLPRWSGLRLSVPPRHSGALPGRSLRRRDGRSGLTHAPRMVETAPDPSARRGRRHRLNGGACCWRRLPCCWSRCSSWRHWLLIAVYSFGTTSLVTFGTSFGWTLGNYTSLHSSLYLGTIERSLILSLERHSGLRDPRRADRLLHRQERGRVQTVLLLAVIVPFWTSFLIRIYAWTTSCRTAACWSRCCTIGPAARLAEPPLHSVPSRSASCTATCP